MSRKLLSITIALLLAVLVPVSLHAQKYEGVVDKIVAVVGNEMIMLSQIEEDVNMLRARGMSVDKSVRCQSFENQLVSKLFLMQARLDSLAVNQDMVDAELAQRIDHIRTELGGDEQVEAYFGKPLYRLRSEWRKALQEQSLIQQMQSNVSQQAPELTPVQVQQYVERTPEEDLPIVPTKYRLSQICVYPDREAANFAVKEKLLALRERIINGEKFSTLARLYSQDPGSARRGGELGMASKSIFWPAFSDAAMSLKPGIVSQIVETPDGFHLIQVIERKGDMFNARHILLKPEYTLEDKECAFRQLDSIRNLVNEGVMSFKLAAQFFSQDNHTKTNGGQMADPNTGSSYFEIDQLKPQDYAVLRFMNVGDISQPLESLDNEGRSGNTVYKILRLDEILPSHVATFTNDFAMIQQQARSESVKEVVDKFILEKIATTYIVLDPMYKDCKFEYKGWQEYFKR